MASIASRPAPAEPASQPDVRVPSHASLRVVAVGVALAVAGAAASALPRVQAGGGAPAGVEGYVAAATSATSRARLCAEELRLLVQQHPGATARAVQLEDGPAGAASPATALAFVDRQLAAATSSLEDLERLDGVRVRDWREDAGGLAMRSHRASDRLCAARDAATGATAVHSR